MYGRREGMRLCWSVDVVFVDEGGQDDGDSCLDFRTWGGRRGWGVGISGWSVDDLKEREDIDGEGNQGEGEEDKQEAG